MTDVLWRTVTTTAIDSNTEQYQTPRVRVHLTTGDDYTARVTDAVYYPDHPEGARLGLRFRDSITVTLHDRTYEAEARRVIEQCWSWTGVLTAEHDAGEDDVAETEDGMAVRLTLEELGVDEESVVLGEVERVERLDNRLGRWVPD